MKKIYYMSSLILLALILVVPKVYATVGGPTFIHNFKYNTADQSIYYVETSASGRGCPPMLMKVSVVTEVVDVMHSCDEGEEFIKNSNNNFGVVLPALYKVTSGYSDLNLVNLKSNGIKIDVNLIDFVTLPDTDYVMNANFTASIYQNGIKISDIPLAGCNTEQPFVFSGYSIPGYTDKMALVISTKNDCMEGGYTYEKMYIVSGVKNLVNSTSYGRKENSALVPSEDTLVVFEPDTVKEEVAVEPKVNSINPTTVIIIIVSVSIGVVLGMAVINSSKKN